MTTGLVATVLDSWNTEPFIRVVHSLASAAVPSPGPCAPLPISLPEARLSLLLQQLCSPFPSPSRHALILLDRTLSHGHPPCRGLRNQKLSQAHGCPPSQDLLEMENRQ